MSLGELLETCRSRRIELWSEAGRLRYRAPQGALDAGLAERLRAEGEALLEHLDGGPGWRAEPALPADPGAGRLRAGPPGGLRLRR